MPRSAGKWPCGLPEMRGGDRRSKGVPTMTMTAVTTQSPSTILIVEDEVGIARMIQVLLEARGFVALVTHSGH
jgi:hypothetical protein